MSRAVIQEAFKIPDAELWRSATKKELTSLHELEVCKLVPRSTVPPGKGRHTDEVGGQSRALPLPPGAVSSSRLEPSTGTRPRQHLRSSLQAAERSNGTGYRRRKCEGKKQLGVKTAILYAAIEEKVFVAEPPGFESKDKDGGPLVMQIGKSLYRLAQSLGNCFHTIDPDLTYRYRICGQVQDDRHGRCIACVGHACHARPSERYADE